VGLPASLGPGQKRAAFRKTVGLGGGPVYAAHTMGYSLLVALVLFSAWVSVHTVLCYYLAHLSVGRAALAFVLFPLAPIWGHPFRRLSVSWVLCLVGYLSALALATLAP
jgi:hypothetical protein